MEDLYDFLATTIRHLVNAVPALPCIPICIGRGNEFGYRPSARLACGWDTAEHYVIACPESFSEIVMRTRAAYHEAYRQHFPGLPMHDPYSVLYGIAAHLVRLHYQRHAHTRLFTGREAIHPIMSVARLFVHSRATTTGVTAEMAFREADASVIEVILAHEFLMVSSRGRKLYEDDVYRILTAEPPS